MGNPRIRSEAQDLARDIEDLIRLWSEAQNMQRQLDEFGHKYETPEAPDIFDSVVAMLDYVERKRHYDTQLQGASYRALEHRQNFEQKSMQLRESFPEDIPLMYTYQSYGSSQQGKTYEIKKTVEEDRSSIQIREMDS